MLHFTHSNPNPNLAHRSPQSHARNLYQLPPLPIEKNLSTPRRSQRVIPNPLLAEKMNGVAPAKLQLNSTPPKEEEKSSVEPEPVSEDLLDSSAAPKETSGVLPPLASLKCGICSDYLNEPVTLQCMHSFCKTCLEKYNQDHYGEEMNVPQVNGESKEEGEKQEETPKAVLCPICLDQLGLVVPQFPAAPFENSRLERIVGLVESDNIVCQNCEETMSEMKCNTCNAWLCVPCMKATHEAPIFESHETSRLKHEKMLAPPKCSQHPLNDLEFFSTEEEMGVCQVCLLKGQFVGKPYCLVSDVRKLRQEDIEKELDKVNEQREMLYQGQLQAEEVITELNQNLEDKRAAVKENFASIREALEKREAETLSALDKLKEAKQGVLEKQIEQTKNVINVIDDGINNVEVVLNHSNDLELVYLTVVLQDFVSDLAKIDAQRFKDDMLDMSYYHSPAVDEELPVVLSERVPQLVSAYASVPSAEDIAGVASGKSRSVGTRMTKEQKEALDEVAGAKANADEFGCVLQ